MADFSSSQSHRHGAARRGGDDQPSGLPSRPSRAREAGHAAQGERTARVGGNAIDRSIGAVERAVATLSALRESRDHYRGLAAELRRARDADTEQAEVFARQLAEADRARRTDRERADRAERRLEQSERMVRDLERQLAAVRAQGDGLLHTVTRLMSTDEGRGAGHVGAELAELLAA